ncbi:MAG: InlB B-repeat-containing protein, partial [Oscillospiraceae bacterium]|nr:InlB B-repeat-containing protein [Oscillospiraceae bacterium]
MALKNLFKSTLSLILALCILAGLVPFGTMDTHAAAASYYFTEAGAGNMDATSWANAGSSEMFADKLNDATDGDSFYLAGGTYYPKYDQDKNEATGVSYADTRYKKTFYIDCAVSIYGGYNDKGERFLSADATDPTILHGNNENRVIMIDTNNNVMLDGLTITGGLLSGSGNVDGVGIYINGTATTIQRCIIKENNSRNSASHGGAIYSRLSLTPNPKVYDCIFIGNTATSYGGVHGVDVYNSYFEGNTTTNGPGAIYGNAENCTIINNTSGDASGALSAIDWARNNTIINNSSQYGSGGLSAGYAVGNIVVGNTASPSFSKYEVSLGSSSRAMYNIIGVVDESILGTNNFNVSEETMRTILDYSDGKYNVKNNGGFAPTIAVVNPTVDIGNGKTIMCMPVGADAAPETDQRGVERRTNGTATIGAFEAAYQVTYNSQGGSLVSRGYGYYNSTITAPSPPTRDGYDFAGWYRDSSYTNVWNFSADKVTGPITLYAKWGLKKYTVTFDLTGGTRTGGGALTQTIEHGADAAEPSVTRAGYVFDSWEGSLTSISSNRTITAQWNANTNTLSFSANGGTGSMAPQSYKTDETKNIIDCTFTRDGYTFAGWSVSADGAVVYDNKASYAMGASSEYTLYAQWTPNNNIITFDANNGTDEAHTQAIATDATANLTNYDDWFTPPTGHSFSSWNTAANGSGMSYINGASYTMGASASYTLFAQWSPNTYDVTFDKNADEVAGTMSDQPFIYNTNAALYPIGYDRQGYSFTGWAKDPDGSVEYNDEADFTMNVLGATLYAVWEPKTNSLVFNANGGAGTMPAQSIKTASAAQLNDNQFTRAGYIFSGWNTKADSTGVSYNDGDDYTMGANSEYILYAQWEAKLNTLTFYPGNANGEGYTQAIATDDSDELLESRFSRTGYTQTGWQLDGTGAVIPLGSQYTMGTSSNYNLYAVWEPNIYPLHFDAGNVVVAGYMPPVDVAFDDAVALPECAFTKPGYTFSGWAEYEAGNVVYLDGDIYPLRTEGAVLYAVWEAKANTVTFHSNDGTNNIYKQTLKTDQIALLDANTFTRIGYTFSGWATSSGGTALFDDSDDYIMGYEENYDLYAVWRPNIYQVTFSGNGAVSGSMPKQAMAFDDTVQLNANLFTRPGYTFIGWRDAVSGTEYADQGGYSMKSEGAVLVAIWSANDNFVLFNAGGGEGFMPPQAIKSGLETPLSGNKFTKTGYSFAGWALSENGEIVYEDGELFDMPLESVVLYAVWTANTYTLSFRGNGASSGNMQPQQFVYDTPAALLKNNFSRDGYEFVGWSAKQTTDRPINPVFDFSDEEIYAVDAANAVLYAVWKPRVFSVTFKSGGNGTLNGGTGDVVYKFYCDDDLTPPVPAPEAGYFFGGWDKPLELIVRGDSEYTAAWTEQPVYTVAFDPNGGAGKMPDQPIQRDTAAVLYKSTFSKPGHTFAGWSVSAASSTENPDPDYADNAAYTMGDNSVTLYAAWRVNYYDVEFFDYDGALLKSRQAVKYNMPAVPPQEPLRPGYTFAGWEPGYDKITENSAITAAYTANENTVTYQNGGGTGSSMTQIINTDQRARLMMNAFSKTGYSFAGWREGENTPVLAQNAWYVMGAGDVTLSAVWVPKLYELTFAPGGGSGSMPKIPMYFDDSVTLPEGLFTRAGYTFTGWNDGQRTARAGESYKLTATGATLTAVWSADENTITLMPNGGMGEVYSVSAKTDQILTVKNQFTRPGYTFAGWAEAPGGRILTPAGVQYKMGVSGITLYAVWEANENNIRFVNGNEGYNQPARTGANIKLVPNRFSRAGYTFAGWASSRGQAKSEYNDAASITVPPRDLTLYPVWSANTNNIVFNADNGSSETLRGKTDETIALPECKTPKKGYTFTHWSTKAGGGGDSYKPGGAYTVTAASNNQLYAVYTPNKYKIAFDANGGGGAMTGLSAVFDDSAALPKNKFTRAGYKFKQWAVSPDGRGGVYNNKEKFTYTYDKNITLYAIWEAEAGRVVFEPNGAGGKVYTQEILQDEAKNLLKCAFTREGYSFAGWALEEDSYEIEYQDKAKFTMSQSPNVLYAVWMPELNTITFKGNGADSGEMPRQEIFTDETAVLLPNMYERYGCVFAGWSSNPNISSVEYGDEAEYQMGVKNVTLYAVWKDDAGTVIFDANAPHSGGMPSQANELGQRFTLIPNGFVREGYYFEGWSVTPGGQAEYLDEAEFVLRKKSLILYAVWKPELNYVIFDTCGGEGQDFYMQVYTGETKALTPNSFHNPGYTFAGWSVVSGFEESVDPEEAMLTEKPVGRKIDFFDKAPYISIIGSTRLYAVWEPVEYTVIFNSGYDLGAEYTQKALCYETFTLTSGKFERRGYTFAGWTTVEEGEADDAEYEDGAEFTMGIENVTLYALWTPNEYLVIFDSNAPGVIGEMPAEAYAYDSWSVLPDCEFDRPGYEFAGWKTAFS